MPQIEDISYVYGSLTGWSYLPLFIAISNSPLIPRETHNQSNYPHQHMPDNKSLPLSSMVWRTQQAQSGAYRRGNHPTANKGKDVDNDVLLVDSVLRLLTSE